MENFLILIKFVKIVQIVVRHVVVLLIVLHVKVAFIIIIIFVIVAVLKVFILITLLGPAYHAQLDVQYVFLIAIALVVH